MSDAGDGSDSNRTDGGLSVTDGGREHLNQYFDALANEYRRHALYYLSQHGTASVPELARYVAGREAGRPPESVDDGECRPVVSALYHKHLPRLDDYGLIDFDSRSEQVRFHGSTRTFGALLWLCQLVEGDE